MSIEAVIFDMDGVLVDSEPAHQRVISQFFEEHGLAIAPHELNKLVGCSHEYFVDWVSAWWAQTPHKTAEECPLDAYDAYKRWAQGVTIDYGPLLNPGVHETLEALRKRGIRLAVASSTSHEGIRLELGPHNILPYFDVVVSGEEFAESKPNPDIYLTTMRRLGLGPKSCIAVEDSDRGIAAALAAQMRVAIKREPRFGFAQNGGTWYLDRVDDLIAIMEQELD